MGWSWQRDAQPELRARSPEVFHVQVPHLPPLLQGPEGAEAAAGFEAEGWRIWGWGGLSWARAEPRSVPVPKWRTLEAPANAQPWCGSKAQLGAEPGPEFSFPGGLWRLCLPPATLIQKGAALGKQFPPPDPEENATWKKQHIPTTILFLEIRSKEDAAQRGQLTGLSRGGFLSVLIKENSLVTCPLVHGGSSVRKGPHGGGRRWDGVGWMVSPCCPWQGRCEGQGNGGHGVLLLS